MRLLLEGFLLLNCVYPLHGFTCLPCHGCYKRSNKDTYTWDESDGYCISFHSGTGLPKVDSPDVHEYLMSISLVTASTEAYIGLRFEGGQWKWRDGTILGSWNLWSGQGSGDCAAYKGLTWIKCPCTSGSIAYLCEAANLDQPPGSPRCEPQTTTTTTTTSTTQTTMMNPETTTARSTAGPTTITTEDTTTKTPTTTTSTSPIATTEPKTFKNTKEANTTTTGVETTTMINLGYTTTTDIKIETTTADNSSRFITEHISSEERLNWTAKLLTQSGTPIGTLNNNVSDTTSKESKDPFTEMQTSSSVQASNIKQEKNDGCMWSMWSRCNAHCSFGNQWRFQICLPILGYITRPKLRTLSGQSGKVGYVVTRRDCDGPCNKPQPLSPVDWSPWEPWTQCSSTCNKGTRNRSRTPFVIIHREVGTNSIGLETKEMSREICEETKCPYHKPTPILEPSWTTSDDRISAQIASGYALFVMIGFICTIIILDLSMLVCKYLDT